MLLLYPRLDCLICSARPFPATVTASLSPAITDYFPTIGTPAPPSPGPAVTNTFYRFR